MDVPTFSFPGGDEMPIVGFGTGGLDGSEGSEAIRMALAAGYGRFDTAEGYANESMVGEALASCDREELFLTSKVLPKHLDYESVISACEASLERLGTDYLDLYLIHWPNPAISLRETMAAMGRLQEAGKVRNVGVSNFSTYQLSAARHVSPVPIAVNQIEFHPWRQRPGVVEYCQAEGIVVEAAAPLARTEVFEDDVVRELARTYDRTPAQVVLRWAIGKDVAVIPKSTTPAHVRSNLDLFDWELDPRDVARLDARDRDYSVYALPPTDWDDETFGISE